MTNASSPVSFLLSSAGLLPLAAAMLFSCAASSGQPSLSRLDQSLSLRDILPLVGLSSGRTRHLFVEQTGLSFRTYLLWLRLDRAVQLFAEGASLTEAAHGAGFADSAHLSRTFRRMFGIVAASLRVG
jgi:AraC-like DNA-binding protein